MLAAGKRKRIATRLPEGFVDLDIALDSHKATKKRHGLQAASQLTATAPAGAIDQDIDHNVDQLSDTDAEEQKDDEDSSREDGEGSLDEEDEDENTQQQAPAALDAPLSKRALKDLNKKVSSTLAPQTQGSYNQYITLYKKWVATNGFQEKSTGGSRSKSKQPVADLGSMAKDKAVNLLYRFFDWYVVKKRPGDPSVNGRQVPQGEYGRSVAMKLHSALQHHLNSCRRAACKETSDLNRAAPYDGLYKVYCSKKRDRTLVKALAEGSQRAIVHMSFGRDAYVRGVHTLLASADRDDACVLSMYTAQVAMVARGDDIRPRTLADLDTRVLTCVGPSMAVALAILQPPTAGKTLGTRPGYKGMLRSKLPALCAMGSFFRWMVVRFKLQAEPIPRPGSKQLGKFFLWPGRAGDEMARNSHGDKMQKLFSQLGVQTSKLTHELRIFAAQLMYEMGVSLEVIQRVGHWLLDSFGTAYIVPGFTAEALLALAFWPGAAQKDFTGYWAERFHVAVPEQLIQLLMPGLATMEQQAAAACAAGKPNAEAENLSKVLRMGAVVVVQDALELAEQFPNNPVHSLLLEQPVFRKLLTDFKAFKALGGFESQRPLTVKETVKDLLGKHTKLLMQHINSALGLPASLPCAAPNDAAGFNWQGFEQLQKESEQDLLQQQQHPLTPEEVINNLEQVAAGQLKPSAEMQQRMRQQRDVLNDDRPLDFGSSPISADLHFQALSSTAAATDAAAEARSGIAQRPAATSSAVDAAQTMASVAAAVDTAAGVPGAADAPAAAFQNAAASGVGSGVAAAAAHTAAAVSGGAATQTSAPAAASLGVAAAEVAAQTAAGVDDTISLQDVDAELNAVHRAESPGVQVAYMVDEPQSVPDLWSTPSGAKYSREEISKRSADCRSPLGEHCKTFWMGQPARQDQHHLSDATAKDPEVQPQPVTTSQQLAVSQPTALILQLQRQQQQQQQLLEVVTKQQEQLQQLTTAVHSTMHSKAATVVQDEQEASAVRELQQQHAEMQKEVQQLRSVLLQRQHNQQVHKLQQHSSAVMQSMGTVDPMASIWQPYITSCPDL